MPKFLIFPIALLFLAEGSAVAETGSDPGTDARRAAEAAVRLVRDIDGIELDYSPESLHSMESVILSIRAEGTRSDSMPGALYVFGAYVGEVIVRNNEGARWTYPPQVMIDAGMSPQAIGVTDANGVFWNPIGKVYKLLDNGQEDSIVYLYQLVGEYRRDGE